MNILFLMTDQLRLDHTGFAGESHVKTPHIDRIAQGIALNGCRTVNPICTPARTALLTGKYSHQIGTLAMAGDLSCQHPTFMRALQDKGYYTAGIGKFHFLQTWPWNAPKGSGLDLIALKEDMKAYGYDYVWETAGKQLACKNYGEHMTVLDKKGQLKDYYDFVDRAGVNDSYIHGNWDNNDDGDPWPFDEEDHVDILTADVIIDKIRQRPRDRDFYIFGSFCSPHKPFDPPRRYRDMFPLEIPPYIPGGDELNGEEKDKLAKCWQSYRGLVKLVDDQIGRIWETLEKENLLENTVILFTTDHGEMMGDHGMTQKTIFYKESLSVPTAVWHPRHLRGDRSDSPVEITDLTATMLDIAGLDVQKSLSKDWPAFHDRVPCRSLMPLITGEKEKVRDFTFSESNGRWYCIQDERYKYVRWLQYEEPGQYEEELYDTRKDPDEICNLLDEEGGREQWRDLLMIMRDRKDWVFDRTPPAQTRWAPLKGENYDPVTDRRI